MGLAVFAILFFIIYVIYSQKSKRKQEVRKIDDYLFENREKIGLWLQDYNDIELPSLSGYSIFLYKQSENVLKPLRKDQEPILLDNVQYSGNINFLDIQRGKIIGARKLFFANKDHQHIYVFFEQLDKDCLVFVSKRTSIDDHLNARYKRH